MKYNISDFLQDTSFHIIGENVGLLKGEIKQYEIMKMKTWILSLQIDAVQDAVLLIDSEGGATCPQLIADMIQTPLHTHVIGKAFSFAGLISLVGTFKTAEKDTAWMFHTARWEQSKEADEIHHDEDVLFRHRYKMMAMMCTILPPGEPKEAIGEAMTLEADSYFNLGWMFDQGVIDALAKYTPEKLRIYDQYKEWYNNRNKGDL